jgi:hypothetical protein
MEGQQILRVFPHGSLEVIGLIWKQLAIMPANSNYPKWTTTENVEMHFDLIHSGCK